MDDFAACVLDDEPVATPGEDGRRAIKIANAAREAAKTGKAVRIISPEA